MNSWKIIWDSRQVLIQGFENTIFLFTVSSLLGFFMSIILIFLLEYQVLFFLKKFILIIINIMRMLPFLMYVYIIYYIFPYLGINLSSLSSGLIALISYHGAYFAEILRSSRYSLPSGQTDSAISYGFNTYDMMLYLILPQILLRSGSLICNQLIYLLKDTSFLTIITVMELTGAAFKIQSIYFIPIESFLVVIILYWFLNILIIIFSKKLDKLSIKKGISNEKRKFSD